MGKAVRTRGQGILLKFAAIDANSDFDDQSGVEAAVFGDCPQRCVRGPRFAPVRRPVTHRVGEHARAMDGEIEAVVRMPVQPQDRFSHQPGQVGHERRIDGAVTPSWMHTAGMRIVVRDDYGLAGEGPIQSSLQEGYRVAMQVDCLLWRQEAASHAYFTEVDYVSHAFCD